MANGIPKEVDVILNVEAGKAAAPAAAAAGAGAAAGSGGGLFGGIIGGGGQGIQGFLGAAGKAGAVLGAVGISLSTLTSAAEGLWEAAKAANPAGAERLSHAFADIHIVMGQILAPLVDKVALSFEIVGDFLASILPTADEMAVVFDELDPLLADFKEILVDLAPVLKDVIAVAVTYLAKALQQLVEALQWALRNLGNILRWISPLAGVLEQLGYLDLNKLNLEFGKGGEFAKTSRGVGGFKAAFVGAEEMGKQLRQVTARMVSGAAPTREQKQLEATVSAAASLKSIDAKLPADPNRDAMAPRKAP